MRAKNILGQYASLASHHKSQMALLFAVGLASAIMEGLGLSMLYPLFSSVIDAENELSGIWHWFRNIALQISSDSAIEGFLLIFIVVFFIKSLLRIANVGLSSYIIGRLRAELSKSVLENYLYGPYSNIISKEKGKIIHNIWHAPAKCAKGIQAIINLITNIIFCTVMFITLLFLQWQLTIGLLIIIVSIFIATKLSLFGRIKRMGTKRLSAAQSAMAIVTETVMCASAVKLLGVEKKFIDRLGSKLPKIIRADVGIAVTSSAPNNLAEFSVILMVTTGFFVLSHGFGISFREVAPLIGGFGVVSFKLFAYLASSFQQRLAIESNIPSLELVHDLVIGRPDREELEKGQTLKPINSDIEFRNVTFGYVDETPVIYNFCLTIPHKKLVGIIGPSGIGKTTLGDLLTRLYDPQSGGIFINDRDIRTYSLSSLRRRIGHVEQDPTIFSGTIEENLKLGARDLSADDMVQVAKDAGIHEFILSLPGGYQAVVGDQGATLSGGQRQRIAIARALARKPDLLIIDEGTSALDRSAERTIQDTIEKLKQKTTVLVIAHRISTLENADIIFEMKQGGKVVSRTFKEVA